jgi:Ferritin-like
VQAWQSTLIEVIKQEMLHSVLAANILTALGAAPHVERPNLRILSRWYPPESRSRCCRSVSGRCGTSCIWNGRRE